MTRMGRCCGPGNQCRAYRREADRICSQSTGVQLRRQRVSRVVKLEEKYHAFEDKGPFE
jgi:hypothetical protein